ncbi:MAG: flagellar protein FlbB [Spirochaetaceae bacterium]|jgi:flagellar protein FlbB|nr:flagellar protein FlbB [Spirochaetaceae bacterium]
MASSKNIGRTIVLLLLIVMISAGGLVWFDYLGVIDIKTTLAPVYKIFGIEGRSSPPTPASGEFVNLDAERLAVLLEAIDLRHAELDKKESGLKLREAEIEQKAAEQEDRQKGLDDRENSLKAAQDAQDVKDRNIEQFAVYLTNMPPDNAVRIIVAMDDQEAIDMLKKVEEMAKAQGTGSLVPVWLMNAQMPPERAAELSRKMTERP